MKKLQTQANGCKERAFRKSQLGFVQLYPPTLGNDPLTELTKSIQLS